MKFKLIETIDNENNELTPEQDKFFKNSKVRNSSGDLLVCYRGTANINNRTGFSGDIKWFSLNRDYSDRFSLENGIVYSVYLNCKRIFDCGNTDGRLFKIRPLLNPELSDEFLKILNRLDVSEELFRRTFKEELSNNESYVWRIFQIVRNSKFKNLVERSGYDCIKTIEEESNVCYGVFNNEDIKLTSNKYPTGSVNINESFISRRLERLRKECLKIAENKYPEEIKNIIYWKSEDMINNAGTTRTSQRGIHEVTINKRLLDNKAPDDVIKATILHEIAHCIDRSIRINNKEVKYKDGKWDFNDNGHISSWKKIIQELESLSGLDIPVKSDPTYISKYVWECDKCGERAGSDEDEKADGTTHKNCGGKFIRIKGEGNENKIS